MFPSYESPIIIAGFEVGPTCNSEGKTGVILIEIIMTVVVLVGLWSISQSLDRVNSREDSSDRGGGGSARV
jgi:hypothetical protein